MPRKKATKRNDDLGQSGRDDQADDSPSNEEIYPTISTVELIPNEDARVVKPHVPDTDTIAEIQITIPISLLDRESRPPSFQDQIRSANVQGLSAPEADAISRVRFALRELHQPIGTGSLERTVDSNAAALRWIINQILDSLGNFQKRGNQPA